MELNPHDMAHGGEAVARLDGKTYFVADAMPGDRIEAEVVKDKGSWARAQLIEVVQPAPGRIESPCPHFSACGGCQWQFGDYRLQREWKQSIVASQLAHLGRVATEVRPTVAPGAPYAYRNRMDFHVVDGKPALYRRRSRQLIPLDTCLLVVDPLARLFGELGDLTGVHQLTLRAGTRTDELLVTVRGVVPPQAGDWGANVVRVRRGRPVAEIGRSHIFERVAGHRLRITANAFFQNNTPGADSLVAHVTEALDPQPDDVLLDGYAGGGLFSVALGEKVAEVMAVETSPLSLTDLEYNLSEEGSAAATIVPVPFEESLDDLDDWTVAVVDPPRTGLGQEGVGVVTAARPRAIAYVSCDPASLARDARILTDAGYRLDWAAPIDLFPQTFHIETVARFGLVEADGADRPV